MLDALSYPFFQRALVAGLLAALACGIVGSFVVVRRMASISGGLSHAAFGGVGLGHLIGIEPLLGAMLFALLGGLGVGYAHRQVRPSLDTLIAMAWSVGMALGMIFVALAPGYAPDLMSYLFGNILLVPSSFLVFIGVLDLVIVVAVYALFTKLEAVAFDHEHAEVMGVPAGAVFKLMLALTALAVVALIRVVGVILVIALLTLPAATAQQWSRSLRGMMGRAVVLGAVCTTSGLLLCYVLAEQVAVKIPTGPAIILLAFMLFAASSVLKRSRQAC